MGARAHGTAEWVERMRGASVLAVAKSLGLEVQPPRGSSGGALPCPACNAPCRHTKTRDRRLSAGVRNDGRGWRCFQCDVSGDALDLVAYTLRGERLPKLGDAGKAEVREWCMRELGLDGSPASSSRNAPRPRTLPAPEPPRPPSYPPIDEVRALWEACKPVVDVAEVAQWLGVARALDPHAVAEMDLARALPADAAALPRWAGYGGEKDKPWRSWPSAGMRLVVPLYDAAGAMRSVLFRRCSETQRKWPPKSVGAKGDRAGLVMANAVARHLLEHPAPRADEVSIVIEEGETDWLTACVTWARRDERAIFGIYTGAWTPELANRIPSGARVTIRTDNDDAGDKLAANSNIITSLRGRCTVLRGGRKQVG